MTIKEALSNAYIELKINNINTYQIDSILLLLDTLNVNRAFLYAHDDYILSEEELYSFLSKIERRKNREPVAYIIEKKEFFGINFRINKHVLIPRPETEFLVEYIINNIPVNGQLLDICTGSGCIPISVKYHRQDIKIIFSDISEKAINVAIRNYKTIIKKDPQYYVSDLFNEIPNGYEFDYISANPPYIKSKDISLLENDIKNYEPIIALDGGEIGFLYYTNILNKADLFLKPDGVLIMEIDDYIYDYILEYINTTKWIVNNIIYDYNKIKRVIVLRRK